MSTEEEYKELSEKLRYGLELAEQRLIEETARREGTLCYGRPDGKVVRVSATELLKLRQSAGYGQSRCPPTGSLPSAHSGFAPALP